MVVAEVDVEEVEVDMMEVYARGESSARKKKKKKKNAKSPNVRLQPISRLIINLHLPSNLLSCFSKAFLSSSKKRYPKTFLRRF